MNFSPRISMPDSELPGSILCTAEILKIDELDCGLDFFDPTDWRYEYRLKKERKNTAARHSSRACGIAIF